LPIKLITVGVIPIIFAVAFLSVPSFAGQLLVNAESDTLRSIGTTLVDWFNVNGISSASGAGTFSGQATDYIFPSLYFILVVMFTYFYTGIMFNSKEIAENLQKQGGFVAGIRPGAQTETYLNRIVNRLTLFGALALGLLAILPFILDVVVVSIYQQPLSSQFTIGGTSVLITVSVAIETLRQIESKALMVTYDAPDA
jgi:preprotein translocase subunit SecY